MILRYVWAPLVSKSTFRRGIHLLLGGVILIPYLLLAFGFAQMYADPDVPVVPISVLVAVTVAIVAVPPFLPVMRGLEISAAQSLLDVGLPEPARHPSWDARLRGATWYVLHLLGGGAAMGTLLYCVPAAVVSIIRGLGAEDQLPADASVPPFGGVHGPASVALGALMLLLVAYVVAGIGGALARVAPFLLGPSPAERIAALEDETRRLAERNRLARELHDSVGHALTVSTMQAAAARQVLRSDPDTAEQALTAIEEASRSAAEDLDHVLGLLRDDRTADERAADERANRRVDREPEHSGSRGRDPVYGLDELENLVEDVRAAGMEVDAELDFEGRMVPAITSREAYRLVQEGLTNAVRHAAAPSVVVRVRGDHTGVTIELSNPLRPAESATGGAETDGRGLRGMRERVSMLGGAFSAGPAEDGVWRVRIWLPGRKTPGSRASARGRE
ncbi:two-component sensor histidine kinase [Actinobacteria bacterium YIM 96077]|uniref:histidine kinase n=1 Tax=Phytoactinopolyspora halophila TaxID=1981511 RepID=A0A329QPF6_9ACTN|nr:histidine kinase [Phytoactinopolyspora halophila]AYY15762.1 two-component sensor histidine kinase [Actinobacteria bacterium YIM 96077]RAW14220.1 two-component sensor histidine kinase [Phytoactinopolyspora halophila]